jgi:hypothetical protein
MVCQPSTVPGRRNGETRFASVTFFAGKKMNPDASDAVRYFKQFTCRGAAFQMQMHELQGKNLACFCKLDQPCHCDVLLKLANKNL